MSVKLSQRTNTPDLMPQNAYQAFCEDYLTHFRKGEYAEARAILRENVVLFRATLTSKKPYEAELDDLLDIEDVSIKNQKILELCSQLEENGLGTIFSSICRAAAHLNLGEAEKVDILLGRNPLLKDAAKEYLPVYQSLGHTRAIEYLEAFIRHEPCISFSDLRLQ